MSLADVIFKRIPAAMLERVVFDQGIVDQTRRIALFKASGLSACQIADQTVRSYGDQAPKLAFGLYQQVYETDYETAGLLFEYFKGRPELQYYNHQASLISHVPTLSMEELSRFVDSVKHQVCLIVCRKGTGGAAVRGTGFLVGPDLVLTCRHVLKGFPPGQEVAADGSRIEVCFDYYYGEPVEDVGLDVPSARKVALHTNWHVESREDTIPDGLEGALAQADQERISKSLDFVLVRLAEPVGLQPLDAGGGRRRGWITLPDDRVPRNLRPLDWIIIPQHPNGFPQRIDLGRYRSPDQTGTRIRYSTNTAPGSSGAPCFNQRFALVGVHNAFVGPPAQPLANQAIRFDHIAPLVRPHAAAAMKAAPSVSEAAPAVLRWSIPGPNGEPHVVLGRTKLLMWLLASETRTTRTLSERVYAAHTTAACAGCTFSLDVLHAEIRDSKTPRAVYGHTGQQLPTTAEDLFLISLLRELGIDPEQIAVPMPRRPGGQSTGTMPSDSRGDLDKLDRWISNDLPEWLGDIIEAHVKKTVDVRVAAQHAIKVYRQQGLEPPVELAAQASAPEPIYIRPNPWDFAYVVLDDMRDPRYSGPGPRTELKGEVRNVIAALIKGKPEETLHQGLRRLRWMFLGLLPDFMPVADADGNGAIVEALNPAEVGMAEVLQVFERMAQAYVRMADMGPPMARAAARSITRSVDQRADPDKRLMLLQMTANSFCEDLLKEIEN